MGARPPDRVDERRRVRPVAATGGARRAGGGRPGASRRGPRAGQDRARRRGTRTRPSRVGTALGAPRSAHRAPIAARWVAWRCPTRSTARAGRTGGSSWRSSTSTGSSSSTIATATPRATASCRPSCGVIRARLRSFDPIVRYGGDEFVCGLTGTDLAEAERRFEAITSAIETETGSRHQRRVRGSPDRRHGRSADRAGRRRHAPDQDATPRVRPRRRQPPLSDATSWSSWSGDNSPVRRPATFPSAPIATQYGNAVRP